MEFQLTFKLELYQFDSCDHELLWIIAVQQKFKKELCENQLAIWNLPKTMTYFMVICKLCVCSVMSNSLWLHGLYVTCQAPLSMEFSRQEYQSGLPFPSSGELPDPGMKPVSLSLEVWFFNWATKEGHYDTTLICYLEYFYMIQSFPPV